MGIHHLAFATRDLEATHDFYTKAMGFDLLKVEMGKIGKGWAKHVFYGTGSARDQLIAFWDLHEQELPEDWSADIGLGLPPGVNHLAFSAEGLDDLASCRDRWLRYGVDVLEIDHRWCRSIYTRDPNGWMVEFCTLTRDLTDADREQAHHLLTLDDPTGHLNPPKSQTLYKAADFQP